jgi:hypothetical protein
VDNPLAAGGVFDHLGEEGRATPVFGMMGHKWDVGI